MALLLFWRHVQHFFQTSLTSSTPAKGFKTLPSGYDLQGSKHVAEQAFKAVAARVSDIKLVRSDLTI